MKSMDKLFEKMTENWTAEDYEKNSDRADKVFVATLAVGTGLILYLLGKNVGYSEGIKVGSATGRLWGRCEAFDALIKTATVVKQG